MKIYYFSYPYSRDPKKMTKQVINRVKEILETRQDIVPFIPHAAFDFLLGFPTGYSYGCVTDWEFEIIKRCDGLVYDPQFLSVGCRWERSIAEGLGIPVYTYEDVRLGKDLETK